MEFSKALTHAGLAGVLAIATASAFADTGPNVVTNGSFDDGLNSWTYINADGRYGDLNWQEANLPDAINPTASASGNYFGLSSLRGAYDTPTNDVSNKEGVYQVITGLTIGHTYALRFYTAASDFRWQGESVYWKVTFGSSSQNGNEVGQLPGADHVLWNINWKRTTGTNQSILAAPRWIPTDLTFTATATTQKLTFQEQQPTSVKAEWDTSVTPYATPAIILLDGISLRDTDFVAPPVPEAGTASMAFAGLGIIGFVFTRRRKAAAA